jgi:hypothetical protein
MYVYCLIAPTRSAIREVLLSISFNKLAISSEAAILTTAARTVSASSLSNKGWSVDGVIPLCANSADNCHELFRP